MLPHHTMAGIEASEFIESGQPADVMLLDIHMPGKGGIDVLYDAVVKPPYPIIAMTGHVDADAQADFRCDADGRAC